MNSQQGCKKNHTSHRLLTLFLSGLVLCLLLLSACTSSVNGTGDQTLTPPPPAIDASTKHQGDTQLQTFQQWITMMKQYGGDISSYQQQYHTDKQALESAKSNSVYQADLKTLNTHVEAIKIPTMKTEALSLQQQLQQQVTSWGQKHQFHNDFDNTNYPLGYEYASNGIGGWVQDDLDSAQTIADYQQAIENLHMYLTNFQAMTSNSVDTTPYNQIHQSDLQIMQHYGKTNAKVIVVSLKEQAMRVYDNGKLVKTFLVTTGRPDRPTPPGIWWV